MKKIILSLITLMSVFANSQTITQVNHFPIPSTQFTTIQCGDSTSITGGTLIGSGVTWDYSNIILRTDPAFEKINYVSTVTSNPNYPQATTSVGTTTNNVSYYSTDGSKQYYWGGNISVNMPGGANIDLNLNFTSPSVNMVYPATYSTTTSYTTEGTSSLGNFTGQSKTFIEGAGTLILSAKTFTDVIRVKTLENLSISALIGTVILNKTTFDYYSISASRHPILTIDSTYLSSILGTDKQKHVTLQKNYNLVNISEQEKTTIDVGVFPNPTSNYINFSTTNTEVAKLLIYDITGKQIATEIFENGKLKKNISSYTNGIYSYAILNKESQLLKIGKFSVTK